MHYLLSWPVRLFVVVVILFSVFVDGAGYIYRATNHEPLTGYAAGMPPHFGDWQLYIHKGLDLSGGTRIEFKISDIPPGQSPATVQQEAIDVIERRINALGTSEPQVSGEGAQHDRILVELAGVTPDRAEQIIGQTGNLILATWVKDSTVTGGPVPGYRPKLTGISGKNITSANFSLSQDPSTPGWVVNITLDQQGSSLFSSLTSTLSGQTQGTPENETGYWLGLTQNDIDNYNTRVTPNCQPPGCIDSDIYHSGKFITNVGTNQAINGGTFYIFNGGSGFSQQQAQDLASDITAGALPATLTAITETAVSASLGTSSVRTSLIAGLLGLVVVIVFMIAFYRLPGLIASVALVGYGGIALMLFKVMPVTMTLPGLAGFILSVGMAVDANVLIFERFKEELRAGRTVGAAVEAGVRRAWPAVRDSNISTMISVLVLYVVGTNQVKGFALTLGVGVVVSMFSSIVVTQNLLAIVFGWLRPKRGALLGVESVPAR